MGRRTLPNLISTKTRPPFAYSSDIASITCIHLGLHVPVGTRHSKKTMPAVTGRKTIYIRLLLLINTPGMSRKRVFSPDLEEYNQLETVPGVRSRAALFSPLGVGLTQFVRSSSIKRRCKYRRWAELMVWDIEGEVREGFIQLKPLNWGLWIRFPARSAAPKSPAQLQGVVSVSLDLVMNIDMCAFNCLGAWSLELSHHRDWVE